MKFKQISRQFKNMGNSIILNVAFVLIFSFLFSNGKSSEKIQNFYLFGSIIQVAFFLWYINWWFATAKLFSDLEEETDSGSEKQRSQSLLIKVIVILVGLLILIGLMT